MAEFKYEIVENLGVVDTDTSMRIELNLIKWGNRKPVLDLRKWNEDHTSMSKGFTVSKEEIDALREMLNTLEEGDDE